MPMRVVYDPLIPDEDARWLAKADPRELVPFSAAREKLVAVRQVPAANRISALFWAFGAALSWYGVVACLVAGLVGGAVFFTLFALPLSIVAWQRWQKDRTRRRRPKLLLKYRRRYVVPSTDLDPEARQVWSRAAGAADTITASLVVREQRVDSVRVSVVLPNWLWEIAEKLALLSEVRAGQRKILPSLDAGAPEVAATLDRQRHVQDMAVADVERKVRQLQMLADRVVKADDAVRKARTAQEAVQQLAALNDSHADLLARIDHSGETDTHEAETLSYDLQAVITQADAAIHQVNEAANSLALADEQRWPLWQRTPASAHPALDLISARDPLEAGPRRVLRSALDAG